MPPQPGPATPSILDNKGTNATALEVPSTPSKNELSDLNAAMDSAGLFDVKTNIDKPAADPAQAGKEGTPAEDPKAATPPADPKATTDPKTGDPNYNVAPKADAKPVETPAAPAQDPNLTPPALEPKDPEIDAIEMPRNLSVKNQENWKNLREVAHREKKARIEEAKRVQELQSKVSELSSGIADPAAFKQELEELRAMRRSLDIEHDPEFRKQYDDVVTNNYSEMIDIFRRHSMPEAAIKHIMDNGGLEKFAKDFEASTGKNWFETEIIARLESKNDGEGNPKTQEQWYKDKAAASVINEKLQQNMQLKYKKELAVQKASQTGSDFMKTRQENFNKRMQEERDTIVKSAEELQKTAPWSVEKEIPANSTPEEKAAIEEHNKYAKEYVGLFKAALYPNNPVIRSQVAASVPLAYYQNRVILGQQSEITRLQAEITRLRGAGAMPKGTAAPLPSSNGNKSLKYTGNNMKDIDAAMKEAGF